MNRVTASKERDSRDMNVDPDSKPRILMVDDEPNILQGYTRTLRSFFNVITATSGAAGLEALRKQNSFAVVVSDLRMPQMDGVTFLQQAREVAPDVTRVLFTGNPGLESAISAVNEGAQSRGEPSKRQRAGPKERNVFHPLI